MADIRLWKPKTVKSAKQKKKDAAAAMARKGKEIQLQQEVETQEEWEDMLSKEGLCVIDVYQEWGGPCSAMLGNFRKVKNELGDPLLKFIVAKADTVDALEKYRGRCEPCFLFYAGGALVAVVRGANAPLILRTITEQLAQEHKVIEGNAERKPIKDTTIDQLEARDREKEEEEEEPEGVVKKKPATPGDMRKSVLLKKYRKVEILTDNSFRDAVVGQDLNFLKSAEGPFSHDAGRIFFFDSSLFEYQLSKSFPIPAEAKKEVSVVIIKPDAVQSGQAEAIMEEMKARGIEILKEDKRTLTEEEVKNVYIHLQDEPIFEELVGYMTSSPCIVLAITKGKTGENIINEFRELMGPTEVEEAKEQKPESLRAKYGSGKYMNAVHGSDSSDTAARELAFFFPDFAVPACDGEPKIQRTLALIRPDAYKNHKDEIVARIKESGFKIAMSKEIHLNKEQAEEFYKEHKGQEYFEELTTRMSSGPLLALGLAREDAISGWRQMLGPKMVEEAKEQQPDSLRAQFVEEGAAINMIHGSDSEDTAQKEIDFFFPMEQTVAVIKPDAYGTKNEIIDKIHESGFRIAAQKETTLSREIAEEFYADHKDKEYYNDLVEHMVSGPTYFMVLSREDAVDGWRSLIGPTDPEQAKQVDPDSLRGKFGSDILKNAVHGSTNKDHAISTITKIFGELYFNKDGTVKVMGKQRTKPRPQGQGGFVPCSPTTDTINTEDKEEEAISEQQQINYETAPELGGGSSEEQQTQQQSQESPESQEQQPTPEEGTEQQPAQEKSDENKEAEEKPVEQTGTTEEPTSEQTQQQEETKPAEDKPAEEKPAEDKPADEGQTQQQEESKPVESEQKQEEPPKEEQSTEETPAQQAEQTKPEEPAPVQEEKQEEAQQQQEESKPEETKPEESQEVQEPVKEEKPADSEEKKDETDEKKEETKTDDAPKAE